MSERLVRLIYRSQGDTDLAGMADILRVSRRRNGELGVTGALLHHEGHFGQVLEGDLAAVEATFDRLVGDPRHHEVMILDLQPVSTREFASWSMTCVGDRPDERETMERTAAAMGLRMADAHGGGIVDLLSRVLGQRPSGTDRQG